MAQVTFYLHESEHDAESPSHLTTACRVAAQCYRNRQRCVVFCQDQAQAEAFDELLWQQPTDAFVPHNLSGEGPAAGTPVEIVWQPPGSVRQVLINLSDNAPQWAGSYRQIYDFVPATDALKQQARERYKQYRAAGLSLTTQPAQSMTESNDG